MLDSSLFVREGTIESRTFPGISLSSAVAVSAAMARKSVRCLSAQIGVRTRGAERLSLEDKNLLIYKNVCCARAEQVQRNWFIDYVYFWRWFSYVVDLSYSFYRVFNLKVDR